MELATVNDENPCGDRGLDAVCPSVAIDGTDGEKWRRRESNPRLCARSKARFEEETLASADRTDTHH